MEKGNRPGAGSPFFYVRPAGRVVRKHNKTSRDSWFAAEGDIVKVVK
jgi:hypothetical protein